MNKLKLGLPAGSLQNTTIEIFKKAGFNLNVNERSYFPYIDDEEIEVILIRAQEIPRYVEGKVLDAGISGKDWIAETEADVHEVAELTYSRQGLKPIKLVLAVPKDAPIYSVHDLKGKKIATELVNVTKNFLRRHDVEAAVEFSWGATEVKPPILVDAIAELTETGRSLKANNLRIIETILQSTPRFIVNKASWEEEWKRNKIEQIVTLLRGALLAEKKVVLKLNVSLENLPEVLSLLPALRKPTISSLHEEKWVAVETVIDEKLVRDLVYKLKEAGAEGIIEYSLNKIIP
ncbi:MAG: ATP phosphoribosyltransferase [Firmicutes bacterium]|nr:ATP phosphoribosyltransferase [Bacillota bacterium]